ncbi:Ubiquitin carboxyl-terminal hydrolase [Giardia muris]|uniref:Ubiquitin carboxyl-terminal hydrolase n=1 Tax=Giardia muris TaxID=5742 RepID=A0A4Z1SLA0_GIAMU|nr:Ubiquitin carboxyl-terminal hydrolase [Giardia muris]|eukprot:TNJ26414.1 Ubiquitin carboxyl-terminal hydrolase [Giardia muris]
MNELSQVENKCFWRCVEPPEYPIYSPHFRICGCPYRLIVKDDHHCLLDNLDGSFLLAQVTVNWRVWNLFNVSSGEPVPPNDSASNFGELLLELFKPNLLRGCRLPRSHFYMELTFTDPQLHVSRCIPGLENQHATCYLNSILQALFYSQPFRAEFMKLIPEDGPAKRLQTVFAAMELLMHQRLMIQPGKQAPAVIPQAIQTTEFTESLGWTRDDATVQGDPHELLLTLFDILEKDKAVADVLKQIFEVEGMTTIERQGEDTSTMIDKTYILLLPISECKTLRDSLEQLCKEEVMSPSCRKQFKLTRFPPVLAISLQRVYFDIRTGTLRKDTSALKYPLELDLSGYGDTGGAYTLFAVVNHAGTPIDGHYYVKVRPFHLSCIFNSEHFQKAGLAADAEKNVFVISDSSVQPIVLDDMLAQDQRETVYMLFYVRTHIDIQSLPLSAALREAGGRLLEGSDHRALGSRYPVVLFSSANLEAGSERPNVCFSNYQSVDVDMSAGLEYSLPSLPLGTTTFYLGVGREEKKVVEIVELYRLSPHYLTMPFQRLLESVRFGEGDYNRLIVYYVTRRLNVDDFIFFFVRFDPTDSKTAFHDPKEVSVDNREALDRLGNKYWKSSFGFKMIHQSLVNGATIVFREDTTQGAERYAQYIERLRTRILLVPKPLTLKLPYTATNLTGFWGAHFSSLGTLSMEYICDGLGLDCTPDVKVTLHDPPPIDPTHVSPKFELERIGLDIYAILSECTALTVETAENIRTYTFHQVLQSLCVRSFPNISEKRVEDAFRRKDFVPPTSSLATQDACLLYVHASNTKGDEPTQYYFYDTSNAPSFHEAQPHTLETVLFPSTRTPTCENNNDRSTRHSHQSPHRLRSPKSSDRYLDSDKKEFMFAYAFTLLRATDQVFIRPVLLLVFVQNFRLIDLCIPAPRSHEAFTVGYISTLMTELSTRLCGILGLPEQVVLLSYTNTKGALITELEDETKSLQSVLGQPLQKDCYIRVDLYNKEWYDRWLGEGHITLLLLQTDNARKLGFFQRYGCEDDSQEQVPIEELIRSLNGQVEECRNIANSLMDKLKASLEARRSLRGFWTETRFFSSSSIHSQLQQMSITPENCELSETEPKMLVASLDSALKKGLDGDRAGESH